MKPITKIKMKYYSREILKYLLLTGAVFVAGSSPYFVSNLMKKLPKLNVRKKKFYNIFNYLKRSGLIKMERDGYDACISLTKEGKKRAGKYQIDDLSIKRSKKWDKKWRVVIFDVPAFSRTVRDAFRKKLKEFGFYPLQKSIWVFPYSCQEEIKLLREFFGLNKRQVQVLEVVKLEDDKSLRKFFCI